MKFVSFNINGLRAHPHQLKAIIKQHQPDVIGLQETKIPNDIFPLKEIKQLGYNAFYYGQKGHYGVALLSKKKLEKIQYGFPNDEKRTQCRVIIAELPLQSSNLILINGYFPQGENRNHPTKFQEKKIFFLNLQKYLERKLRHDSLVLIMGDMNISPSILDIGIGENNRRRWLRAGKCSFLPEEQIWINRLLGWGLIDTFRNANPHIQDQFSWFDYRFHSFKENHGLRIDLILASFSLKESCISAGIDYQIRGMEKPSDHAPVWATFRL